MYTITLSDGKKLENLTLNGNNFISDMVIDDSFFKENLDHVEIFDGEKTTVSEDLFLASNRVDGGKSWIVLLEKTEEMKRQEQIEELKVQNETLLQCILEMSEIVYA